MSPRVVLKKLTEEEINLIARKTKSEKKTPTSSSDNPENLLNCNNDRPQNNSHSKKYDNEAAKVAKLSEVQKHAAKRKQHSSLIQSDDENDSITVENDPPHRMQTSKEEKSNSRIESDEKDEPRKLRTRLNEQKSTSKKCHSSMLVPYFPFKIPIVAVKKLTESEIANMLLTGKAKKVDHVNSQNAERNENVENHVENNTGTKEQSDTLEFETANEKPNMNLDNILPDPSIVIEDVQHQEILKEVKAVSDIESSDDDNGESINRENKLKKLSSEMNPRVLLKRLSTDEIHKWTKKGETNEDLSKVQETKKLSEVKETSENIRPGSRETLGQVEENGELSDEEETNENTQSGVQETQHTSSNSDFTTDSELDFSTKKRKFHSKSKNKPCLDVDSDSDSEVELLSKKRKLNKRLHKKKSIQENGDDDSDVVMIVDSDEAYKISSDDDTKSDSDAFDDKKRFHMISSSDSETEATDLTSRSRVRGKTATAHSKPCKSHVSMPKEDDTKSDSDDFNDKKGYHLISSSDSETEATDRTFQSRVRGKTATVRSKPCKSHVSVPKEDEKKLRVKVDTFLIVDGTSSKRKTNRTKGSKSDRNMPRSDKTIILVDDKNTGSQKVDIQKSFSTCSSNLNAPVRTPDILGLTNSKNPLFKNRNNSQRSGASAMRILHLRLLPTHLLYGLCKRGDICVRLLRSKISRITPKSLQRHMLEIQMNNRCMSAEDVMKKAIQQKLEQHIVHRRLNMLKAEITKYANEAKTVYESSLATMTNGMSQIPTANRKPQFSGTAPFAIPEALTNPAYWINQSRLNSSSYQNRPRRAAPYPQPMAAPPPRAYRPGYGHLSGQWTKL